MAFEFLAENLKTLQTAVDETCQTCDRDPKKVFVLPVTKRQPLEKLQALYDLGERQFAENRVQEMLDKAEQLPSDLTWHLIGPLQSNKVRQALKFAKYIHSVDSAKLLNRIERIAGEDAKKVKVFLQVNITEEEQKSGFSKDAVEAVVKNSLSFENIEIIGLMAMGRSGASAEETKATFCELRELRDSLQLINSKITELSMGMSGDYKLAIQEGSTYIRVGSLLLGDREY
ncbi:MAG: YggS family pyridoxal phosphate-dependent enzyme [Lentisphaeraceae bacterium]|nr:YggS family pyridoxal phosphate-dependent enzyme [Lentisphaeraceae bacterium]